MLMLTALIISTFLNIIQLYIVYRFVVHSSKLEDKLFMANLQRDLELPRDLDTPVPTPEQLH
jgi:hypothetical protein